MSKFVSKIVICGLIIAVLFPVVAQNSTFTDPRDGKTYRTVRIDGKTWMAENLNYEIGNSSCFGNDNSNCDKYGRLYNWSTAMKACPSGWRLPNNTDWDHLAEAAGGQKIAGKNLKSKTGWSITKKRDGNGTDDFGWSALPGSYHPHSVVRKNANLDGRTGYWWSANGGDSHDFPYADHRYIEHGNDQLKGAPGIISASKIFKSHAYSVRCVQ